MKRKIGYPCFIANRAVSFSTNKMFEEHIIDNVITRDMTKEEIFTTKSKLTCHSNYGIKLLVSMKLLLCDVDIEIIFVATSDKFLFV